MANKSRPSSPASNIDPGAIGDVRVKRTTTDSPKALESQLEADISVSPIIAAVKREREAAKKELAILKRRAQKWKTANALRHGPKSRTGVPGQLREKNGIGQPAIGKLKATVTTNRKWDLSPITGILPISKAGLQRAASFRNAVQEEVRKLFAGTNPGLYAWKVAESAVRHEMRAIMMEELLCKNEDLTVEQKVLLIKHLCDASDSADAALKRIGLDRLSEMPEAIDPWMVAPAPPDELPADVISPPVEAENVAEPESASGRSEDDGSDPGYDVEADGSQGGD